MTDIDFENQRLLDIVNEKDEIIGSKPRADIHKLGLLHREVHVWMFDKDNNIFFQKRGLHRPEAGRLDVTVGGHVNQGEDYLEAAVRETEEETGIKILPTDLVFLKKYQKKSAKEASINRNYTNKAFKAVYIYKYPVDETQVKKEVGIPGGGFQKVSSSLLLHPTDEYSNMFKQFILLDELPEVIKFIKSNV